MIIAKVAKTSRLRESLVKEASRLNPKPAGIIPAGSRKRGKPVRPS